MLWINALGYNKDGLFGTHHSRWQCRQLLDTTPVERDTEKFFDAFFNLFFIRAQTAGPSLM